MRPETEKKSIRTLRVFCAMKSISATPNSTATTTPAHAVDVLVCR
jgi:hypothetical protein